MKYLAELSCAVNKLRIRFRLDRFKHIEVADTAKVEIVFTLEAFNHENHPWCTLYFCLEIHCETHSCSHGRNTRRDLFDQGRRASFKDFSVEQGATTKKDQLSN